MTGFVMTRYSRREEMLVKRRAIMDGTTLAHMMRNMSRSALCQAKMLSVDLVTIVL